MDCGVGSAPRRYTVTSSSSPADDGNGGDVAPIRSMIRVRSKTLASADNADRPGKSSSSASNWWFCCTKLFWKRKTSSPLPAGNNNNNSNSGGRSTNQDSSYHRHYYSAIIDDRSSSSLSIDFDQHHDHSSSDQSRNLVMMDQRQQQQNHRRARSHSFYKHLLLPLKRSRTADGQALVVRRAAAAVEDGAAGDFEVNTEEEMDRLLAIIARLLEKLNYQPEDIPAFGDEECVVCASSRASMQSFPCGHKVLCKMCFVRTIQIALRDRQLPLRCVVCRSRVIRFKPQSAPFPVVVLQKGHTPGSNFVPQTPSPLPPSGIRRPGYM